MIELFHFISTLIKISRRTLPGFVLLEAARLEASGQSSFGNMHEQGWSEGEEKCGGYKDQMYATRPESLTTNKLYYKTLAKASHQRLVAACTRTLVARRKVTHVSVCEYGGYREPP